MPIQGHHKHIGSLQLFQQLLTVRLPSDGITEGGTQALQDRGAQQKCLHRSRLLLEHFLDQVVQDVALAATHLLQHLCRIRGSL